MTFSCFPKHLCHWHETLSFGFACKTTLDFLGSFDSRLEASILTGVWQLHQYVPLESQKERITQRCHFPIVMLSESLTILTKDGEQRQSLVKTKCSLKDGCSDTEKHIVEIMVSYKHWTQETKSPWLTYIAFHVTKYITQWCQPIWNTIT